MRRIFAQPAPTPTGLAAGDGPTATADLDDVALAAAYAAPAAHWVRANMISSIDGAITGPDGVSASLHTPADNAVFALLRALADVVLVGAGTVRAEGYDSPKPATRWRFVRESRSPAPLLAVVTHSGALPPTLYADPHVLVITPQNRAEAVRRSVAGDRVLACGVEEVDLGVAILALRDRGLRHVLCEGGPSLLGAALAAGIIDELDLTWSPLLVGGPTDLLGGLRLSRPIGVRPELMLADEDGTLLGRWFVRRER